jgi:hypothetical protein
MRTLVIRISLLAVVLFSAFGMLSAQEKQDKYGLKEPNGISFAEIRGYETWQAVARKTASPSRTDRSW